MKLLSCFASLVVLGHAFVARPSDEWPFMLGPREEDYKYSVCGLHEVRDRLRVSDAQAESRSLGATTEDLAEQNGTLVRRTMTLPLGDDEEALDKFILEETDDEKRNKPLNLDALRGNGEVNTARFQRLTRNAFGLSVTRLQGCTTLVLASRRAVYVAHWWESLSFAWSKNGQNIYSSAAEGFNKGVLGNLKGEGGDKFKVHPSLQSVSSQIDDDTLKGIIIYPSEGLMGGQDPYHKQRKRYKSVIEEILPVMGQEGRWIEYPYERLDDADIKYKTDEDGNYIDDGTGHAEHEYHPLEDSARGRVLFKFDPQHEMAGRPSARKMVLWTEWTKQLDDEWNELV